MATTARRKKISKKKVVKKEVVKEFKDVLDKDDLIQLENISRDVTIAQKDMALEEQSLRNMNLELELFKHKMVSQRGLVQSKADRYENIKEKYTNFKKEIFPKYGLSDSQRLGYNPDTGEIIKD